MGGLSFPSGLNQTKGLSVGDALTTGTGLSFDGFGVGPTPPGPPGNNGILQEGSVTDFIMLEDGTSFLLQE